MNKQNDDLEKHVCLIQKLIPPCTVHIKN